RCRPSAAHIAIDHAQRRQPAEAAVRPGTCERRGRRAADERADPRHRRRRACRNLSDHARAVRPRVRSDHDLVRSRGGGRHRRYRDHALPRPHGRTLRGRRHRHAHDPCRHHASHPGNPMTERSTAGAGSGVGAAADPLRGRLTHARLFFWAQTVGIVILLAVILTTPGFLAEPSILALLTTVSFIGCVAIGMTLITISGNIMSFALGATVGVTAMVFILAANWLGLGAGVLVGLAFGSLLTGLQGLLIGWVRANPIIVSIAALA